MTMEPIICSAEPLASPDALITPPRSWPECFSTTPLKKFCAKVLRGKRARLVESPQSAAAVDASLCTTIKGFALFESKEVPGVYVAKPQSWLQLPQGTWLDPTRSEPIVLIESSVTAEEAAAAAKANAKPVEALDISDAPAKASTAEPPPPPAYQPKKRVGNSLVGLWRSVDTVRMRPAAHTTLPSHLKHLKSEYNGVEGSRKNRMVFPGKKAQVRLLLRPDNTFDLEARRWGREFDGLRDGGGEFEGRREPDMFAPLEYLDKEAAALHVSGTWEHLSYGDVALQLTSVNEMKNGEVLPPVTAAEIYYACGKALGRPIKCGCSKEKPQLALRLNEYLEHVVVLEDPQWPIE